jgi:ankyrin repeat protein
LPVKDKKGLNKHQINSCEYYVFVCLTGADLETGGHVGESVLHVASRRGHVDILKYLLKRGAAPNIQVSVPV